MKLEQSFEVDAPLERVWEALIDVERVAPALPGAAVTGQNDDGTYGGTFTVKIGPTTASYAGKLVMEEVDEEAHRAVMQANGSDKRGQGGAKATIVSQLEELDGGRTKVDVATDYHITGRLARFGRGGMIEDISEKLLREFAKRLQEELTGEPAAADAPAPDEPAPLAPAGDQATSTADAADADAADSGTADLGAAASDGPDEPASAADPAAAAVVASAIAAETPDAEIAGPESPSGPTAPPQPRQPMAPSEPLDAGSLVGSVLWERVRKNPLPLAFLAGLLFAIALFRRRRHD
ncbi:MAG TPA: SRPBCC family protein [Solirubrobacteraceae bacterium]